MASNTTKWSRKRSNEVIVIEDESRSSPTLERDLSKKEWKVKTLDEILQEKRRRLDHDSPEGENESFRQSSKSSVTSSPGLQIDSRASSKNQTPTQEIIYQLSPDHSSPISTSSETNRKKTATLKQKPRRKTDEEEGEILSDISDPETGGTRQRSRVSSRHVSTDIEMVERPPVQDESRTQQQQQQENEEESSDEDSDSSGEDEQEEPTKNAPTIEKAKNSEEEEEEEEEEDEESSDSSEESEDSSEEEEEEEEENIQTQDTKNNEEKVEEKEEDSSEDDSEEDSDDDSESDDVEDSSDDNEKEEETNKDVQQNNTRTADEVDSKVQKEENVSSSKNTTKKAVENPTKSRETEHHSVESSRHRKHEQSRVDEKDSGRVQEERSDNPRSKKDRKGDKEDMERVRKKHKSSSESSDYKKPRNSKSRAKDRDESTRSRSDRQSKEDFRAKRKELKPSSSSKEESKPSNKNRDSNKLLDENHKESKVKTNESRQETLSKILTEQERLQFASEVVDTDSDDNESAVDSTDDDDDSDNEESIVSQAKEVEEEKVEEPKLPDYLPAIQGCRIVDEFAWLNRIEEGTYGVVYRARDKRTNEIVALKRLKMEKEKEGFPITSLREINTLLKGQHPNIVTVREVVVGKDMDKIFIVMDYVEHDLKTLMEHMNNKFAIGEVKTLLVQLLRAVTHLHDNWILHRDLKTSNLLLSNKGILKVADFGLAREYGSPLKPYTPIVVTLWYRAPELLLGVKEYACPIDLWSVGCIFAELLTMKPLFPGKSEIDQINRIFKDLGTPSDKIWPGPPSYSELPHVKKMTFTEYPYNQLRNKFGTHLTDKGFDLLNRFLTYDPTKRITADEALKHEYFNESPYPVKPDMFPTWPAKSEMQKRPKKKDYEHSPKAPEGGEMFSKLKDGSDSSNAAEGLGFHMPSSKKGSAAVAGFSLKFNLK